MRVAILIDGGYVDKTLPRVDYRMLLAHIVGQDELVRSGYYDCMPLVQKDEDRERFDAKHRKVTALSFIPRMHVRLGMLKQTMNGFIQKQVDCAIVADMVMLACKGRVDRIVLVGADSDMIPGIRAARAEGCVVELWITTLEHQANKELKVEVDEQRVIDSGKVCK